MPGDDACCPVCWNLWKEDGSCSFCETPAGTRDARHSTAKVKAIDVVPSAPGAVTWLLPEPKAYVPPRATAAPKRKSRQRITIKPPKGPPAEFSWKGLKFQQLGNDRNWICTKGRGEMSYTFYSLFTKITVTRHSDGTYLALGYSAPLGAHLSAFRGWGKNIDKALKSMLTKYRIYTEELSAKVYDLVMESDDVSYPHVPLKRKPIG